MSSGILFNSHDLNDIKCTPCFLQPGANNIFRFLHVISWGWLVGELYFTGALFFRPMGYYPSIHGWIDIYPCWLKYWLHSKHIVGSPRGIFRYLC